MLKPIEDKENRLHFNMTQFFNSMSDKDFIMMYEMGQLRNFCNALTVDLNTKLIGKDEC
tara:strand:- start:37 stop:213 length:177 start_codon:yes stop_codon:yes gene_type:complete